MKVEGKEGDEGSPMEASWEGERVVGVEEGEGKHCGGCMRASNHGRSFP